MKQTLQIEHKLLIISSGRRLTSSLLGSLRNDDDDAVDDAAVEKNEFIFYKKNSRFSRSVQYTYGSKNVLRLTNATTEFSYKWKYKN